VLTVLLAAIAIGAAGCGSSSKTSTTSTPRGSRTTTVKTSGTTTAVYHAGEFCTVNKAAVYRAQGLKCVKVKGTYRLEKRLRRIGPAALGRGRAKRIPVHEGGWSKPSP
jgi:hypothetical protein